MCDESDQRLILNREKRHNSMLRSVRRILRLSVGKGDPRELIDQVCSCLTETPGYFNAWIVLVDEDSVARQVATAGDGPPTAFQELATSIKAGDIPPCARQAIQSDMAVSVILDPRKECGSCLMAPHYAGRAGLSAALRYDDRNLGVLTVSVLPELAVDSEELALLEDLADDIAFALHSIELAVKTQKSLDESRALYDVLVDSAPVGILVHQDEKLVFVNNEGARIFGASEPSEIVGRSIWDFVPEDLRHKTKDRIRRRAGTNTPDVFDIRQRRLTGEEIDVRVTARQVSYDGRPGTHVIFQNISDSKRVEQALRDSEQRFSRAFRSSPVAMTISKIHNGRLLDANDKWLSQWGFSLEEVVGRTPDEFGYWAEMDERSELVSRLRRDGEVRDFEASFIDGNNNKRVASVSGEFAEISGKKRLLLAFSDITDRLQAEAALRESEARFKSFMDAAPFGLAAKDTQGRFTYANHVVCGHFDVPQEAIIGKTAADFRRPDIAAAIAAAERVVVETGISQSYEGIMDDLKDGVQALRNIRFPLRNSDGEIAGIGVVTEDISDRNRAETALRESEERFSTAFQWNPVALCISRMDDGCHIDVNDRWLLELGHTRDEAIGRSAVELGVWADPPQRTVFVDRLKRDGIAYDFDALFRTKDGVEKSVLVNGKIIEVNAEQRLLIAFRDVTEHNQMARQLLQAQKMEAVGQLTGGVAHDFNNLLQVVETSLELAREMIPEGSKANELVNGALRAGHRGARLTQQLLAFSRKQTLSPENLD
ncbi:MAG: PAS domain S-box protein, partial [Alphaproteobacteria bacterium]|nr:PAS domain S-box protein [Alphaproteobacteria bacterium]